MFTNNLADLCSNVPTARYYTNMPLRYAKKIPNRALLALWQTEEPDDWFRSKLLLQPEEREEIAQIHPKRVTDWYSTRYLIHLLSGDQDRKVCLKDAFGRPFLSDSPFHVSISHSDGLAAVILTDESAGIDIQRWDKRMERLAPKFITAQEQRNLEDQDANGCLHVLWGAKEALYKAYGRRQLDFKTNIFCSDFLYQANGGTLEGLVEDPEGNEEVYSCFYKPFTKGMLVYALRKRD